MLDTDTLLTTLYVMVDDFLNSPEQQQRQAQRAAQWTPPRGPQPSLTRAQVITLAVFGQWQRFTSERDFYRWAQRHLRELFPTLPHRTQFNRLQRRYWNELNDFWQFLTDHLPAPEQRVGPGYEAMDLTAVVTRDRRRRGSGWLCGQSAVGRSSRLGWFEGFNLLICSGEQGAITGWALADARTKDQPLAEVFLEQRSQRCPELRQIATVGHALDEGGYYLTDSGFAGRALHLHWWLDYGAEVITVPQRVGGPGHKPWRQPWDSGVRRWVASSRQVVERSFNKLHHTFRLRDERPHQWDGLLTRLAAKITLHNFCIYLNRLLGRKPLAFCDLWDW